MIASAPSSTILGEVAVSASIAFRMCDLADGSDQTLVESRASTRPMLFMAKSSRSRRSAIADGCLSSDGVFGAVAPQIACFDRLGVSPD